MSWMRLLFERNGGWMPHKTQVHLPTSSSKKLFYIRMLKELEDDLGIKKEDNISYEYFTEIWRQHLPEFVIPKKQEFVKCNICVQLREDLARAKTAMERGEIKDLIDKHVQQVEIERRVYHNTREQARTESDEVMCVIQDGMDQAKTSIPHLVEPDKLTALLARIRLHLTGNIIHTNVPGGKIVPAYLDVLNFPHDSNLSMNLLLQSLVDNKVRLSRRLFAQMDNCYRENKIDTCCLWAIFLLS
ncbi:uncharacterized protein [Ptychodera flava]|uniref:uncharacterized protein isoform X1 n=1 Tax=Ptychodera flava TaxID=63121 RepID=UPI00396A5B48